MTDKVGIGGTGAPVRWIAAGMLLLAAACSSEQDVASRADREIGIGPVPLQYASIGPMTSQETTALYRQLSYDLASARNGGAVPRILLVDLPVDLDRLDSDARKEIFLATLLPIILDVNERIMNDRTRVERYIEEGAQKPRPAWLRELAERYETSDLELLARRIDIVPPSLALAQAAIESGWGRSRFAQSGNALFGQRTYGGEAGMRPRNVENASFRVRSFETLAHSVESYIHNLNTHEAYVTFRVERAKVRESAEFVEGLRLAGALDRYSERGGDYVEDVRLIITHNQLQAFDTVSF